MSCGTCPSCTRAAALIEMREHTYPLVVPVLLICPRSPWRRQRAPLLVRWGHA